MRISILYFAVFRERIGHNDEHVDVADGAPVSAVIAELERRHPAIRELAGHYRIALNQEMVSGDPALADGDELALIPPVAGGAGRIATMTTEPPNLEKLIAAVTSSRTGGIATFTGVVRDHSRGTTVERLDYEAYVPMAEKVMAELCDTIETEVGDITLAVEHRMGSLGVGDVAVAIACGAPHRQQAFEGCQKLIDRLKEHVPIWKKEYGPDGSIWVGLGP